MQNKEGLVWGIILVLAGLLFLAFQLFPSIATLFSWPWLIIGAGIVFLFFALVTRTGGLMIPGTILTALGGIFLWQSSTGNWESWAYIWALMPASVAVGMLLGGLLDPGLREARGFAMVMLVLSLAALAIFGGAFGLSPSILRFWPVLLILFGAWILLKAFVRPPAKDN
jgi:hypothetical protein